MDREKIDGWCEKGILGLVLAILIFAPLALGAHGMWQFLVVQGLTLGVMTLWGGRIWIAPSPKLLWPPICWAVLAFMIYAVIRYLQADIEYVARDVFEREVYALAFGLFLDVGEQTHLELEGEHVHFGNLLLNGLFDHCVYIEP